MNFQSQSDSYSNLQKQLDEQHKRLLKQRQEMLSRQSERLQLYQKLDLVEFFNYEPSESEPSKKEMMYHLSEKFKNYMRNLTQNNVYKRMGHIVNDGQENQRSVSKSKGKTNVDKNSELGRIFQMQRYYGNQYQANNLSPRNNHKNVQRYSHKNISTQDNFSNDQQQKLHRNSICQKELLTNQTKSMPIPESEVLLSAQQLSHALDQQQKIYLLTELNHYIKLYKGSETKKQFMTKHLQNLHEYLVDVRFKYQQKHKNKSRHDSESKSYNLLVEENQMLKREIETYKRQIKALNVIQKQDFYGNSAQNQQERGKSKSKCIEVKKIDRFQEFAQHIQIMQTQLSQLIENFNRQSISQNGSYRQAYIQKLEVKIQELETFISEENRKKDMFLEEVKKFKEIRLKKDEEILTLKKEIRRYQAKMDKNLKENNEIFYGNVNDLSSFQKEKSKSKSKYYSPRKSMRLQKENEILSQKDEFDRFIDSALKNTDNQQSQKSFRYSRVTTKEPSQAGLRNSQLESSKVINYRLSSPSLQFNEIKINQKPNEASRTAYHSGLTDLGENLSSRQKILSQSRSKYSSKSKERSKTNFFDNYEPKPYDRYNNPSEFSSLRISNVENEFENNPLYSRISESQRDRSNSKYA